jgi:protein-S-isoprenylcysteine O-methyltransferase Ste14
LFMLPQDTSVGLSSAIAKRTGELRVPTASHEQAPLPDQVAPGDLPARRDFTVGVGELIILFVAIVGAISLGLGITAYLGAHPYIVAYLVAYAAFRLANLLLCDQAMMGVDRLRSFRRVMYELPLLALFFAAPFERTFIYGGEPPRYLVGLGLLIELAGIWLALGARIQRGFFSAKDGAGGQALIQNGLYRYIRHPIYAGESLVWFAWPFEYGAPVTLLVAIAIGLSFTIRRIRREEAGMMAQYGDAYAAYMRATDRMIPNLW